jgi:hypothetical protein
MCSLSVLENDRSGW